MKRVACLAAAALLLAQAVSSQDEARAAAAGTVARAGAAQDPVPEMLGNGLRLVVVERPALPMVTFALYLDFGAAVDGLAARGRTRFSLPLVWLGCAGIGEDELRSRIEAIGGRVGTDVAAEHSALWLSCLARHGAQGLDLLYRVLTEPTFDPGIVARERDKQIAIVAQSLIEPSHLAQERYVPALLGDHPYAGALTLADPAVLRAVDADVARSALARVWLPQHATLFVIGPRDEELLAAVRARFAAVPRAKEPAVGGVSVPLRERRQVEYHKVPRPQMGQVYMRFGAQGVAATAGDRAAVEVCQLVLAGGFTSVLVDELRVNQGLIYGIGLTQEWLAQPSPFSFITSTRAEKTEVVLATTFAKVRELQEGKVADAVLQAAKNSLLTRYAAGMQTHLGMAGAVYEGLRHFGDAGWWRKHVAAIGAVTKEDVVAASQRYDPETFCVVLVGEAGALERLQLHTVK